MWRWSVVWLVALSLALFAVLPACSSDDQPKREIDVRAQGRCVHFSPERGREVCLLDAPQDEGDPNVLVPMRFAPRLGTRDTTAPDAAMAVDTTCLEAHDQGKCGWCTEHATTAALEAHLCGQSRYVALSVPHLHWLGHGRQAIDAAACESGWFIERATATLESFEHVASTVWPYFGIADPAANAKIMMGAKPTDDVLACEARHRAFEVRDVPPRDIGALEGEIAAGRTVVVSIPVRRGSGWTQGEPGTTYGDIVDSPTLPACDCAKACPTDVSCLHGWHAALLVGYDRNARRFIFLNSWSPSFGKQGYGTMAYDFVARQAREARSFGSARPAAEPIGCAKPPPQPTDAQIYCTRTVSKSTGRGRCSCGAYECVSNAGWGQGYPGCACELGFEWDEPSEYATSTCAPQKFTASGGGELETICCITPETGGDTRCRCGDVCELLSMKRVPNCNPDEITGRELAPGNVIFETDNTIHTAISRAELEQWVASGRATWIWKGYSAECDEP